MAIDQEKIKFHIRGILEALGDDPDREGLKDTPDRVARMYTEVFEGMNYSNDEIAEMFNKTFEAPAEGKKDMVFVKDISIFSYCEHHMALMYDMKVSVAYIPKNRVIGLSKIARIAEMVGKRLRYRRELVPILLKLCRRLRSREDVAVIISGKHSCMTARGIKNTSSSTVTTTFRGKFNEDANSAEQTFLSPERTWGSLGTTAIFDNLKFINWKLSLAMTLFCRRVITL